MSWKADPVCPLRGWLRPGLCLHSIRAAGLSWGRGGGCADHAPNEPQRGASLAWAGLVSAASSGPPSPIKAVTHVPCCHRQISVSPFPSVSVSEHPRARAQP